MTTDPAETRRLAEEEAEKAPPLTDEQVRDLQGLLADAPREDQPEEKRGAA